MNVQNRRLRGVCALVSVVETDFQPFRLVAVEQLHLLKHCNKVGVEHCLKIG